VTTRRYRMGRRQTTVDVTRARILAAARRLLLAPGAAAGRLAFSLEAVARRARVARMTVYHQFGSRRALLEALFDDVAARGGMGDLRGAFGHPDPEESLARYVVTFGRFWASDRLLHRRLQALAVLDAELGRALDARQEWRREGLRVVAGRLGVRAGETIDVLFTLTSFHTFDTLAGAERGPTDVVPVVLRLVRAVLGLSAPRPAG
jgi:AcrR family transcriptional regulator